MITEPLKLTINSSTATLATLGDSNAYGYAAYAVDTNLELVPWYIMTSGDGTEVPVPAAGLVFDNTEWLHNDLFYAKSYSGDATLVVVLGNPRQV